MYHLEKDQGASGNELAIEGFAPLSKPLHVYNIEVEVAQKTQS